MSRIWAALPLLDPADPDGPLAPSTACWWRHPLPKNDDGHIVVIRTDSTSDLREARLGCWEWFDGCDEQLILGVDVFKVNVCYDGARSHIDVLAVAPPTPSLAWRNLTEPGSLDYQHDPRACGIYTG